MFDITAIGEILIDFTPYGLAADSTELFGKKAGGAPVNMLAAAAKTGCKTAFIGNAGKDMFGDFLESTLKSLSINTDGLHRDSLYNTTLAFVSLNGDGDRDFSFYRNFNADVMLEKDYVKPEIILASRQLHFGSLSLTHEKCRRATDFAIACAKKNGVVISFDPNYRKPLWNNENKAGSLMREYAAFADIIKASEEEAYMLTGENGALAACKKLSCNGSKIILITKGKNGSYIFSDGKHADISAPEVKAVDTTGAGDIFFGVFCGILHKTGANILQLPFEKLCAAAEKASLAAAESTQKKGGIASVPDCSFSENN